MSPKNRATLSERVTKAAEAALAARKYVCPIDVLAGIGWLDPGTEKRWRQGQVACLESVVQANLSRISEAMEVFRSWADGKGLTPSETSYVGRTPARPKLRFSVSGDPAIERLYRTHWVAPELSEKGRARLAEKMDHAPDLVVIQPLNHEWTCHHCGNGGDLLIMENSGPACLRCAGLDDLEFLPAGDALLTRRAKTKSAKCAVVVRFSRSRRRYERQGLLVEPRALAAARRDIMKSDEGETMVRNRTDTDSKTDDRFKSRRPPVT
ncbi:hypothetical protein [Telmatospirillum sp.]|uniref:hypothetical protein n=1 Tax=Telmatospirillum sp. TaxID=2079197 RepID=UPI00284B0535|nr:hypothetical protein [Telmatospirillum sp.]MDR3437026.1 hypothetical protein [Telmatospirillum sp.]